jgi:multidrug efflux system membrane fusion protein
MHAHALQIRRLLPLLALLLVACGGTPSAELPRPVLVVQATPGQSGLEAFAGEVHAREEPPLSFRIGGKIARRLADAGAHVQAGQVLAELDATDVRLQSEAWRAQQVSAESDLALAKSELDRYKNLIDTQLVSRSLYDAKLATYQAAQAKLRQARAQSSVYGNQAGYAVLRAPSTGLIAQRLAVAGQVVAAGQTVFVLAVDGEREVAISLPEQSVRQFALGRDLAIELWAVAGKQFPGKLRELAPAADPQTRTYAARVSFSAPGVTVDLGQSARVYAQTADGNGIAVPLSALVQKGSGSAVWVVRHETSGAGEQQKAQDVVRLTAITIGAFGETSVPVRSGLMPGDWVVAAGAHLLREGEAVHPVDRDDRAIDVSAPSSTAAN